MFFDRFRALCEAKGVTPSGASREIGFSKGSVSYWKKKYEEGIDARPDSYTAAKMANYFDVSVDYLLGRTEDPVNYEDGYLLAEIPQSYLELAGGDVKKAYAIMKAADDDARQYSMLSNLRERFGASDAGLLYALYGEDGAAGITEDDIADIRGFAEYIKTKRTKNDS